MCACGWRSGAGRSVIAADRAGRPAGRRTPRPWASSGGWAEEGGW